MCFDFPPERKAPNRYTYDERYTFTVSVRGDASNQFGQDVRSRFKPIWALGGRWNLAKEHFLDNRAKWMNDISLRASYGYQANVAENYGPDLILKYPTGAAINTYTGANVLQLSQLPYGNLRPEQTQTFNLGLDFSLLNARITGSVDYYVKNSKDLITFKDIPYENGVTSMPINVGTLYNRGIDIALNFIPIRNKNFTWALGIVTSRNINKITSNQYSNPTWLTASSGNYYVNGYATGSFWVFDFAGLDSTSGMPKYNIPTVAQNPSAKTDATAYMKYAGRMTPDFTGNFNTTFSYKRLTVSTNFYMSFGGKKLLAPLYTNEISNNTPNEYNNYSADLVNRWRKPGDEKTTNIPSLPQYGPSTNFITLPTGGVTAINGVLQAASTSVYALYNFSSLRVVDATYFRINNINVSYNIPDSWAKKVFSKRLFVTYTVSNPFTFVNKDYKGRDLEVASGSQPLSVSHVISISATF
ncbi:MAG: TonB-dependent receptor [Bacteroidetes bacterium]|nr:TonB-dependent receptor [Bacteroidota bacterium]